MVQTVSRRHFLSLSGSVGVAGVLPGCGNDGSGSGSPMENSDETPATTTTQTLASTPDSSASPEPRDLSGYVRPDDDPQTVPDELVCDDEEFARRRGWIDETVLQWGTVTDDSGTPTFALRTDALSVERGETVTVTLMNVSDEERESGNVHKANFDVFTDAGWQDPRGWPDGEPKPVNDDLWGFAPGERVSLSFELTDRGVVRGAFPQHEDELITCPGLPAGRYRFATAAPEHGDVAVAFDLQN